MPLKTFPPWLKSPVVPVFVILVVPEKVQPFKYRVGLVAVTLPPKADTGPKVSAAVPVRGRFCGVAPTCVNCRSNKVPAEKPAGPMLILSPADKLAEAPAFPPQ